MKTGDREDAEWMYGCVGNMLLRHEIACTALRNGAFESTDEFLDTVERIYRWVMDSKLPETAA